MRSGSPVFACCAVGWVYCGVVREGVRVFSDFAIWYLFLAGTAGGAFLCATVMDVRANPGWDARRVPLCARCGMFGAFGLLALAALMLFCDLGDPFDIWYLFENPLRSIVSMGAWLIVLGLAFSLAVSAMIAARIDMPYLFRCLEIAGAVAAVGVMGYTGVLLSSMAAVEFWNTWLLVALFVVSAVSCGCAFVSLSAFILSGSVRRLSALEGAARLLRAAELVVLAAFLASRWLAGGEAQRSCELLFSGQLAGVFWGGLVLCGFAIPVFAELIARVAPVPALRPISAASTLAGGLYLRYCVVLAASHAPISLIVT